MDKDALLTFADMLCSLDPEWSEKGQSTLRFSSETAAGENITTQLNKIIKSLEIASKAKDDSGNDSSDECYKSALIELKTVAGRIERVESLVPGALTINSTR